MRESKTSLLSIQPGIQLGDFLLMEEIGVGGMGRVFRAHQTKLNRDVALKIMLPEFANMPEHRERFLREARSCGQLEHERIVRIYQVDEEHGVLFLAMELLKGQSLSQYLEQNPIPDLNFTLRVARQVVEGLDAAHAKSLIHRDIKPSNVWLEPYRDSFRCKILDFGLARDTAASADAMTGSGRIIGTPTYMSPEQWRGEPLDHRTDYYSLGVMLFRMTTGEYPYGTSKVYALMRAVEEEEPHSPLEHNPGLPPTIEKLILGLLEKDREDRIGSRQKVFSLFPTQETFEPEPRRSGWVRAMMIVLPLVLVGLIGSIIWILSVPPNKNPVETPEQRLTTERDQSLTELQGLRDRIAECIERESRTELDLKKLREALAFGEKKDDEKNRRLGELQQQIGEFREQRQKFEQELIELKAKIVALEKKLPPAVVTSPPPPPVKEKLPPGKVNPPPEPKRTGELLNCTVEKGATPAEVVAARTAWSKKLNLPEEFQLPLDATTTVRFVLIPPGEYWRGAPSDDSLAETDRELPQQKITISRPFYLGKFEVTRGQFAVFVRANSYQTEAEATGGHGWDANRRTFVGPDRRFSWKETGWDADDSHPAVNLSWNDGRRFAKWIEEKFGPELPEGYRRVRFPTEAEWEYAARSGTRSLYPTGVNDAKSVLRMGNVADASARKTFPDLEPSKTLSGDDRSVFTSRVGMYEANAFGLHDTTGNAWEWCEDWYGDDYYSRSPRIDPTGPDKGNERILRGGSFYSEIRYFRVTYRNYSLPTDCNYDTGFRVALVP